MMRCISIHMHRSSARPAVIGDPLLSNLCWSQHYHKACLEPAGARITTCTSKLASLSLSTAHSIHFPSPPHCQTLLPHPSSNSRHRCPSCRHGPAHPALPAHTFFHSSTTIPERCHTPSPVVTAPEPHHSQLPSDELQLHQSQAKHCKEVALNVVIIHHRHEPPVVSDALQHLPAVAALVVEAAPLAGPQLEGLILPHQERHRVHHCGLLNLVTCRRARGGGCRDC